MIIFGTRIVKGRSSVVKYNRGGEEVKEGMTHPSVT